jgi:hypothetical protein
MTPKLKKIIIALAVLGILFVLYTVFIKSDPVVDPLVEGRSPIAGGVTDQDSQAISSQITQALLKIEQIKLDRSIFENQIFASLEDRSEEIIDEPVGRSNPFAPLGDTSVNVTTRANLNMGSDTQATTTESATTTPSN